MITSYHNTNKLSKHQLSRAKVKAVGQEESIINIFEHLSFVKGKNVEMTPREILSQWIDYEQARFVMPEITSIRRAMTNLTARGLLVKTDKTKISESVGKGSPEHCWRLAKEGDKQMKLTL